MRGIDTNVLVRYLVKDDPRQTARVEKLIEETLESDDILFLNHIVLFETVWVLEAGYDYPRDVIADALDKLLLTQQFEFEHRENVRRAVTRFQQGKADFADHLIGETNLSAGCDRTATFDHALRNEPGFEVV